MIHEKAYVDAPQQVHKTATVRQFASITGRVQIGPYANIWPHAVIHGPAHIGQHSVVASGALVPPGTYIGENVFIGHNTSICNDMWPRANSKWEEENFDITVQILNGASIGAGCIVLPGVTIGAGAMVAAGTVVNADVPENTLLYRNGTTSIISDEKRRLEKRIRRITS